MDKGVVYAWWYPEVAISDIFLETNPSIHCREVLGNPYPLPVNWL